MSYLKIFRNACLMMTAGVYSMAALAQLAEDEDVNQYGVRVNSYPLNAKASNEILVLENKDKGYKFWMDNRIQVDGAHYFGLKNGMLDDVDSIPVMPGGISLRRVRMAVKAIVNKDWYGEVDLNFSNGVFELEDAYIQYNGLKGFQFQAGNFKEDFSMEETTTSRYTTFMERAMVVSCFAPGRHAGLQGQWQQFDFLRVSGGISWQLVDNANTRFNVEEYNKIGKGMDPNYTGKVVFMPWGGEEFYGLHLGYNASFRGAKKTDDNFEDLEKPTGRGYQADYFSSRNATAVNRTKFIATDKDFVGVKHDILQGFELAGYWNSVRFNGEYIMNKTVMDEKLLGSGATAQEKADKHFYGFYAQASYLLFGGKHRYDVTQSEFTQPTRGQKWGDVEVMARYDFLSLNSGNIMGGSGQNYTFGVVYHANNNVKMMVNYQYSQNDRYANNKNKAYVGLDKDGKPTKSAENVVSDIGVRFNTIQARIEIAF